MFQPAQPEYVPTQADYDYAEREVRKYIVKIKMHEHNRDLMEAEVARFNMFLDSLHVVEPASQKSIWKTVVEKVIGATIDPALQTLLANMWNQYLVKSTKAPVEPYAREPSLFSIDLSPASSQHSQISSYHSARYPTMPMGPSGHSHGARINLPVPAGTPGISPPRTSADSGNSEQWPIPGPVNNDHLYALPNPHHGRMQEAIYRQNVGKPGWYSPLPPPHRDHRDPDYPTGVVFGTPDSGHHASSSYGGNPQ
ncbi:unnamed protein product [Mycena citricolor]|uniref:Uncharacterized protein n=1 Tax=Mycena citricolor TaxID=2018698 RepID=A0AAD2K447_9AGAR|nr:unnamed protein product [Mycena citricolor]